MPTIPAIAQTDSLDIWRQIDNQVITAVNNEGINEIVEIVAPQNDQDILVYQASGPYAGFFINTGIDAFVSSVIAALASQPTNNILPYYLAQTTRQVF